MIRNIKIANIIVPSYSISYKTLTLSHCLEKCWTHLVEEKDEAQLTTYNSNSV